MFRIILLMLFAFSLQACATHMRYSPAVTSELAHGKRLFADGYYRRTMTQLLPLACSGIPEAEYTVGYLYYYGYGVAQDTDMGYFWIKRAADKHFPPAIKALAITEVKLNSELQKP